LLVSINLVDIIFASDGREVMSSNRKIDLLETLNSLPTPKYNPAEFTQLLQSPSGSTIIVSAVEFKVTTLVKAFPKGQFNGAGVGELVGVLVGASVGGAVGQTG